MRVFANPSGLHGDGRGGWCPVCRGAIAVLTACFVLVAGAFRADAQSFRSFQADQDIMFGVVATGMSSSGYVTLDAATGAVTTTGGITFFGGTVMPARFSGQGHGTAQHCTVTLTFPESATVTNGSRTATASHFTLHPASVTLSGPRRFSFQVGARLTVPSGLPAGTYSGTITATAIFTDCGGGGGCDGDCPCEDDVD